MKIWIVDAFTTIPYTGNPTAIGLVDEFPADQIGLNIAKEIMLVGFIKPLAQNHFHIRWFTPTSEIPLCGQGTLSAAHILYEEGLVHSQEPIHFKALCGDLIATQASEGLALNFPLQPVVKDLLPESFKFLTIAQIIAAKQAGDCIILELQDEAMVRNFEPNFEKILSLDYTGLIITAKASTKPYDFVSRYFVPRLGINEDPVTGSAHCKLADYWQRKLNKKNLHAYQASARGGEILIEVSGDRVSLTSRATTMMKGEWLAV